MVVNKLIQVIFIKHNGADAEEVLKHQFPEARST